MVVLIVVLSIVSALLLIALVILLRLQSRKKNKPENEKEKVPVAKIQEIIVEDDNGNKVNFTRPLHLEGEYREVQAIKKGKLQGTLAKGALTVGKKTYSFIELQQVCPNGIFSASVDPSRVSQLINGQVHTSIVGASGTLVDTAGLAVIGRFNPLNNISIGIQAMAMISGQYYLHRIYEQLGKFTSNVEKLLAMHDDEKTAILLHSRKRLMEITRRESLDEVDIQEIRQIHNNVGTVFFEYKTRLEREREVLLSSGVKGVNVSSRINKFSESVESLSTTFQICLTAERLMLQSELAEIACRSKKDISDPTLEELYGELKTDVSGSFYLSIAPDFEGYIKPLEEQASKVVGKGKDYLVVKKDKEALLGKLKEKLKPMEEALEMSNDGLAELVLKNHENKQDVVILYDDFKEESRVFLPYQKENKE